MNAPAPFTDIATAGCRDLALAALGALLHGTPGAGSDAAEARFLRDAWQRAGADRWPDQLARTLALPGARDAALMRAAALLQLPPPEVLAVALAAAVEDDPLVGRLLAWLQGPGGGARPSLGLLARAFAPIRARLRDGRAGHDAHDASDAEEPQDPHDAEVAHATDGARATHAARQAHDTPDPQAAEAEVLYALAFGAAVSSGLLVLDAEDRPLCDRTLRLRAPMAAVLAGVDADWPGQAAVSPPALQGLDDAALDAWAARLAGSTAPALLLRGAGPAETQAAAAALAMRLHLRVAWFGAELPAGADLWLALTHRLPVLQLATAPGEVQRVPALSHYRGALLVLADIDGGVRRDDGVLAEWKLPRATLATREALWRDALGDTPAAAQAARRYRAAPAHAAEHSKLARLLSAGAADVSAGIAQAARMTAACRALDALAMPLPGPIADEALVVAGAVRAELQRALQRCAQREHLHDRLGTAARTRASEGVRLLFTGASGTGKSLAAQWLASRLGLPVYRVDLAAMLSKWIGETEKNLAELLARAESADVLLLFDEADTLFGKRTEVASANDRFANAQTNYLLQRIETHDGIVVLTANSRSRFDPAFARRLDFIVDFGAPDAQVRRELWLAHLGDAAQLDTAQINRLAALADFAGGHIRNAVLAAAASAGARDAAIGFDDIAAGVRAEYRKLGRTPPLEL